MECRCFSLVNKFEVIPIEVNNKIVFETVDSSLASNLNVIILGIMTYQYQDTIIIGIWCEVSYVATASLLYGVCFNAVS